MYSSISYGLAHPPIPPPVPAPPTPPPPPEAARPNLEDLSSGESEMESSDEEVDGKAYSPGPPRETKPGRKRVKREAIAGPGVDKDVAHEAVGIKIAPKVITEHKDECSIMKESEDSEKEDFDLKHYATLEELKSGKLPPEEILSLPMFKNYAAGNPAPVLYIKNLAKDVVVDDFYFIFGSLFGSVDAAKSGLSVKLMQGSFIDSCACFDRKGRVILYEAAVPHLTWVNQGAAIIIEHQGTSGRGVYCIQISVEIELQRGWLLHPNLYHFILGDDEIQSLKILHGVIPEKLLVMDIERIMRKQKFSPRIARITLCILKSFQGDNLLTVTPCPKSFYGFPPSISTEAHKGSYSPKDVSIGSPGHDPPSFTEVYSQVEPWIRKHSEDG
ncbi:U11/U12 small nuclear ribonucleoprotein 65 kDa protein [Vitis vinifera]|uniref:U11/U12 small nuclear ribonucleoprotein 65 kDa protein n=1 Tax=Vitis vinifera TaxID=29760 RepID=A0A438DJV3_VITVI|nr:U11/U12 small nuclear ribonucleoprotein 65 kDa protein [Vitis vinifera]